MSERRKVLRLTEEQAVKLSLWLRTAADAMRERAKELDRAAKDHSLEKAMRNNARTTRENANHAEQLADRLDPSFRKMLARLAANDRRERGRR